MAANAKHWVIVGQEAEPVLPIGVAWQVVAPNGESRYYNVSLAPTQTTGGFKVIVEAISAAATGGGARRLALGCCHLVGHDN